MSESREYSARGLSDREQPEEKEPTVEVQGTRAIEPLLLRVVDVARALGLGRSTVFALLAAGELPVVRIGRSVRVPRVALERWIDQRTEPATNRADVQGPEA